MLSLRMSPSSSFFTLVLFLSMMSYRMEYPFGNFGSVVLSVSSPIILKCIRIRSLKFFWYILFHHFPCGFIVKFLPNCLSKNTWDYLVLLLSFHLWKENWKVTDLFSFLSPSTVNNKCVSESLQWLSSLKFFWGTSIMHFSMEMCAKFLFSLFITLWPPCTICLFLLIMYSYNIYSY